MRTQREHSARQGEKRWPHRADLVARANQLARRGIVGPIVRRKKRKASGPTLRAHEAPSGARRRFLDRAWEIGLFSLLVGVIGLVLAVLSMFPSAAPHAAPSRFASPAPGIALSPGATSSPPPSVAPRLEAPPTFASTEAPACELIPDADFSDFITQVDPNVVGTPTGCPAVNAQNGDILQQTTTGLLYIRHGTSLKVWAGGALGWHHIALKDGALITWESPDPYPPEDAADYSA